MTVGVFRDEAPRRVVEMVNAAGLQGAQLHGHETPADAKWIRAAGAVRHQGVRRRRPRCSTASTSYGADAVLIDSPTPGSGQVFDWVAGRGLPPRPAGDPGRWAHARERGRGHRPGPSLGRRRVHAGSSVDGRRAKLMRSKRQAAASTVRRLRPARTGRRRPRRRPRRYLTSGSTDDDARPYDPRDRRTSHRRARSTAAPWASMGEPTADGRFGEFGGRFVPETLMPACLELEAAFREAWADPAFRAELDDLLRDYAGRPSPLTECHRLSERARRAGAAQARGPQPHRLAQDQQRPGPGPAGPAHGQDAPGRRDRRRPARRGHAPRPPRCSAWSASSTWARSTWSARRSTCSACGCSAPRCVPATSGSRTLKDAVNEAMRDWVATVETTHYCLGSVMGPHPYPWMVREFQRVIGDEARAAVRGAARRRRPRRGRRLRRRRLQRHRASSPASSTPRPELVGVEPAGGAAVARGVPGVVHGMRSYLMQDEFGQVLEAESISAGLDYPGVGPEHSYLSSIGPGPLRDRHRRRGDRRVRAAGPHRGHHPGARAGPCPGVGVAEPAPSSPGQAVLVNLSGRGDKDVAQMMEILGEPGGRARCLTDHVRGPRVPPARAAGARAASCSSPTSPAASATTGSTSCAAVRRRRCRRHRDRHPVLRPGHGRPGHPGGLASRPWPPAPPRLTSSTTCATSTPASRWPS